MFFLPSHPILYKTSENRTMTYDLPNLIKFHFESTGAIIFGIFLPAAAVQRKRGRSSDSAATHFALPPHSDRAKSGSLRTARQCTAQGFVPFERFR
jgi:hypothetical protein